MKTANELGCSYYGEYIDYIYQPNDEYNVFNNYQYTRKTYIVSKSYVNNVLEEQFALFNLKKAVKQFENIIKNNESSKYDKNCAYYNLMTIVCELKDNNNIHINPIQNNQIQNDYIRTLIAKYSKIRFMNKISAEFFYNKKNKNANHDLINLFISLTFNKLSNHLFDNSVEMYMKLCKLEKQLDFIILKHSLIPGNSEFMKGKNRFEEIVSNNINEPTKSI